MVLSSQQPRPGMGRRHMYTKRRRKRTKGPIVLAVMLMVIVGIIYVLFAGTEGNADNQQTGQGDVAQGGHRISDGPDAGDDNPVPPPPDASIRRTSNPDQGQRTSPPTNNTAERSTQKNPDDERINRALNRWMGAPANANVRTDVDIATAMNRGMALLEEGQLVGARELLSRLLAWEGRKLSSADANNIRVRLAEANQKLVFSPKVYPFDTIAEEYTVKSGDLLAKIAERHKVPWQLLARINNITDPRRIRAGQTIKVIHGPMHVEVYKSSFRLDVMVDAPNDVAIYIRSFDIGLGALESPTPEGQFFVRQKDENPRYDNQQKGLHFPGGHPENPVGTRWIGIEPTGEAASLTGSYGIHGTIEPESIGQYLSDGCIRMRTPDVELLYDMLIERGSERSTVIIKP